MINKFNQIDLSDAEILKLYTENGNLCINLKDWQENAMSIIFKDVIGFEAFSPEGEELSHGKANQEDPFIKKACNIAGDHEDGAVCFRFWSSWSNESILAVVARGFDLVLLQSELEEKK